MRAVLIVGLIVSLTSCSPSPSDLTYQYASAWAIQNCTLTKMQNRKELPLRRAVTGAHVIYLQIPN